MKLSLVMSAICAAVIGSACAEEIVGDPLAGKKLYWEGVSADGKPITARTQGDIEISGAQFSCVSCHRPSAYGSSEGGQYVPPIRGDFLYEASHGDRNRLFKELYLEVQSKEFWAEVRDPRFRPAYTDESLAKALVEGKDPTGRSLKPSMPRYQLSEQDAANVIAFLKTLSTDPDPGVKNSTIHFATVMTPDVDPEVRKAVLSVFEAYFKWINIDIVGDKSRPQFSPLYRSDFLDTYRNWRLHLWDLKGPPESWGEQLAAYYEAEPVFAVVGGIVEGPHAPIADFCDRTGTPCIFPITELPQTRDAKYRYNIYFSRGRELEGEVMANYLTGDGKVDEIRQFYLEDKLGATSAVSFLKYAKMRGARVTSQGYPTVEALNAALGACCDKATDAVVVWPGSETEAVLPAIAAIDVGKKVQVGLPSDAIEMDFGDDKKLLQKLRFAYPYEKPGVMHPREFDVRAWMGSRRVRMTHPREQFEAYFALTMIEHGLEHLLGDFSRDYLIELVEHEAEKNLNIGTHPTLALGPGQRFASKGAFVMRQTGDESAPIEPVSEWIVP